MRFPDVLFHNLEEVLLKLGFVKQVVPDLYILFQHQATDTLLVFPLLNDSDPVPQRNLVASRVMVDGRGILEASAFDTMLYTSLTLPTPQAQVA